MRKQMLREVTKNDVSTTDELRKIKVDESSISIVTAKELVIFEDKEYIFLTFKIYPQEVYTLLVPRGERFWGDLDIGNELKPRGEEDMIDDNSIVIDFDEMSSDEMIDALREVIRMPDDTPDFNDNIYDYLGDDENEDVYLGDGVYIKPDGSCYDTDPER